MTDDGRGHSGRIATSAAAAVWKERMIDRDGNGDDGKGKEIKFDEMNFVKNKRDRERKKIVVLLVRNIA